MNREYHKWYSPVLGQEMELLVFGHAGERVIVFPTRYGRFYEYENGHLIEELSPRIEAGHLQVFCVDSIDAQSLYAEGAGPQERIQRHLAYQRYILEEVVPFSAYRNPQGRLVAHGCSLGAYHAMNIALRHPHHFARVVAFSGRYDLTEPVGVFRGLFDGYYDDAIYFNTPTHFLARLTDEALLSELRRLEVLFVIGRQDVFLPNNQQLAAILSEKSIPHQFYIWDDEAHRPRYWRSMVRLYL